VAPWPSFAFVLIRQTGKQRPMRGLILDWRGTSRKQALVACVAERTPTRPSMVSQEWIWQDQLIPVDVDPNYDSGRYR
jgi:hypothetical protein